MTEFPGDLNWLIAALRSSGDPMIAADASCRILWMNEAAETLTGARMDTARQRPMGDLLPLLDESTGLPPLIPLEKSPAAFVLRRADLPDCPIEVSCSTAGTSGFLLTVRDLTARREQESLLMRTARIDAISGLAGGVGHDLNNILTIINGYTEELRITNMGDPTAVNEIAQAAVTAAGMTRSLMTLARRSACHPETLVLGDLVAEMSGAISRQLSGKRTLRLGENPAKAQVQVDATLVKQVLMALAAFARDAKPEGGEFAVETAGTEVCAGRFPGWKYTGPCVQLAASHPCEPMDAQALARIFEPACTSRQVAFAHGIGLAHVYAMVTQSGGFIRVLPVSEGRITFEILLPRVDQLPRTEERPAAGRSQSADAPLTVLLVEDDASIRRVVHNCIERAGYHLLEAGSAEDGASLAETCKDPIHILVTDVVLPGMSGRELADKLKASRPGLKVLLVSGFPRNTLVHTGAATGHRFLPKPFTASELMEAIRGLAQEEVEPAPTV